MSQLTLFSHDGENNQDPLPIKASKFFDFPLQYHIVDGVYWYALQDWLAGALQATPNELKKAMADLRGNFQSNLSKMGYKASDGKTYQRDFSQSWTLYRAVASMREFEGRTTLKALKDFLADSAEFAEAVQSNPDKAQDTIDTMRTKKYIEQGKDLVWIQERKDARVSRKQFTDMVKAHVLRPNYGKLTNAEYVGLFERTAEQLNKATGASDPRDNMLVQGIALVRIAETTATQMLGDMQSLDMNDALRIMNEICDMLRPTVLQLQSMVGRDIATGKKLLT